ncbi:MAG: EAL domain-containing protein [Novosphingobium sp.]|nr:EAL domain-containing protein [Novosphingobium sp.]MBO9603505.1 EAL domain-containing protein [Novosphingobium sp.]
MLAFASIAFAALVRFNVFELIVTFSARHEAWQLDELLALAMVLLPAFAIYAWRRQRDATSELTLRVEAELQAETLAMHDALTGLPNRRHFRECIAKAVRDATDLPFALLLIDLNRFKNINEGHGHNAGDQLIVAAARRLEQVAGAGAKLGRLGGKEFAILLRGFEDESELVGKVAAISRSFEQPFALEAGMLKISASIGATYAHGKSLTRHLVLAQTQAALARSKARKQNGFCFFEPGMEAVALRRAQIESKLGAAIAEQRIKPYFQPIVRLAHGSTVGFEVLARWHADEGSHTQVHLPDDFIPAAEDAGLIGDLYYCILQQAARAARGWSADLFFAINVSPRQFHDEWLVQRTLKILTEEGIAPGRLEIEITETALMEDMRRAQRAIAAFKSQGIKVALDDFGTGYSSLVHLRELAIDKLKIDRSFIQDLDSSETSQKIVGTICALAHSLGASVTAEGIDSLAKFGQAREFGCDLGQGYLFGAPTEQPASLFAERTNEPQAALRGTQAPRRRARTGS